MCLILWDLGFLLLPVYCNCMNSTTSEKTEVFHYKCLILSNIELVLGCL